MDLPVWCGGWTYLSDGEGRPTCPVGRVDLPVWWEGGPLPPLDEDLHVWWGGWTYLSSRRGWTYMSSVEGGPTCLVGKVDLPVWWEGWTYLSGGEGGPTCLVGRVDLFLHWMRT